MPKPNRNVISWGGTTAQALELQSEDLASITKTAALTRGFGRSYGDSSLPAAGDSPVASCLLADRILGFDETTGTLSAESGLSIGEIQRLYLTRGWTFPVLPGTQFVTLGGAVASDVHGKNHHVSGSIGQHVTKLKIHLADGRIVDCSRQDNATLFRATLGGMGLTGHILEVSVRLQRAPSPWIWSESERIAGLDDFIDALRAAADDWPFTVGWLDAISQGRSLGRGILIKGRWAERDEAPQGAPKPLRRLTVPIQLPGWTLNRLSVRLFNELYFRKHPGKPKRSIVHPETFFHPLDAILHWNRIYGRRGFTQHQCVLPEKDRPGATQRYLEALTRRGLASFLCVIKDCGAEGEGMLSFPRPGISIAVDLPMRGDIQQVVDELNELVLAEGGRIYLTKDTVTRPEHFRAMEPRLEAFLAERMRWDPQRRIRSAQSVRLLGDTL
ncbi:MAG: FAD-binding oxidoreductase [Acidobacteriota bacterium]|nr:FAD-binding oxidoreductase [Acidobacteriota bacterium]